MANQKIVNILIQYKMNDADAKKAAAAIANLQKSAQGSAQGVQQLNLSLKDLLANGAKMVGLGIVFNELNQAVQKYVQTVGISEQPARKWMEATQDLDNAWVAVGRTVAQKVLPAYQMIANLAKTMTSANPAAGFAHGLEQYGLPKSVTKAIEDQTQNPSYMSPGAQFLSQQWMEQKGLHDASSGIDLLSSKSGLSDLISNVIAGGINQFQQASGINVGKGLSDASDVFGHVVAGSQFLAAGTPIPGADPTKESGYFNVQQLLMMRQYQQQTLQIERQTNLQKTRMQRDYTTQETYALDDFNRTRARSNRDFQIQMAFSEKEFYRQRAISVRDFNIQMARNDYDYQKSLSRNAEDHAFELKTIIMGGDGMAYWQSQRSYNLQKSRAAEDFNLSKQRSQEDMQRSLADSQLSFDIQRNQTILQRNISLADQDADFKIQRDRRLYSYKLGLSDMDVNLKEQKIQREQAFRDQWIAQQDQNIAIGKLRADLGEYEISVFQGMITEGYNAVTAIKGMAPAEAGGPAVPRSSVNSVTQFDNWKPSQATGGYTADAITRLHSGEFVLTAATTKAAENAARSNNLTQDGIINMMNGGSRSKPVLNYYDHRTFARGLSPEERDEIRRDTESLLMGVIDGTAV